MPDILQMGVDDVYFLIKRLGSDCDDYQQYRELTHNAIEAIERARRQGLIGPDEGQIVWDVDWLALSEKGVYRLNVSDNGDGMTAEDLKKYINTLSSSGGVQSLAANYGVGAKIAAATRNPEGLVYQSWQNGAGVLAQLVIDESARDVGFRRWEVADGVWEDIVTGLSEDARPETIAHHGVSVSLMGTHDYDHTFLGPKRLSTDYKSWWLFRTLNRRYFRVPVTIKVRVFQTWDPENWPKSPQEAKDAALMRTVFGQNYYLDKYCIAKGTVPLSNATAHYFVMDPERGMDQRQFFEVAGHVAALYQDELYEMRVGNTGRKVLQNFGAVFSAKHLVIYIEPNASLCERITTNTARTELIVDGGPLPWMDWADEFRDNLPAEIKELENEIAERGGSASHADSIRDRLKKIRSLFKVTRYKPVKSGDAVAEGQTVGNVPRRSESASKKASRGSGGSGGRSGNEYLSHRTNPGENAVAVTTHSPEPYAKWVSVREGTREQGDMEDRAARYLRGDHLILINADFRVFSDLVSFFETSYSTIAGATTVIRDTVYEWCEQQLVEAVMGVRAVEGSKLWDQADIDTALSEEALTVAVMPRYHTWVAVKRTLGRKLGTLVEDGAD